jgi:hypothetical protein
MTGGGPLATCFYDNEVTGIDTRRQPDDPYGTEKAVTGKKI